MTYCQSEDDPTIQNIIDVRLTNGITYDPTWRRNFYSTSSCGICGKASIEAIKVYAPPLESSLKVSPDVIYTLDAKLRAAQTVFHHTGGLHAAGLFDPQGNLLILKEDVGRHNAVDKLIGYALLKGKTPLNSYLLMVSGRASFEIMQKAFVARIPMVVAVSAPSSLAVEFARECSMTLVGFLRDETMNLYAGEERIEKSVNKP